MEKIQYLKGILEENNTLLKRILEEMMRMRDTKWMRTTLKFMHEINVKFSDIAKLSKEKMKEKMTHGNGSRNWRQKQPLHIYKNFKKATKEEEDQDNCEASIILNRAQANCLPLYDQRRHIGEDTTCRFVVKKTWWKP